MKKIFRYPALFIYYSFARFLPATIGRRFRGFLVQFIFKKCGKNINVERMAYFGSGKNIELGTNSGIGINAQIYGVANGELIIGNDVMMGPDVVILTMSHNYEAPCPMNSQGTYDKKVIIEDDVWIGVRVVILPGIKIGKGSVVGAGAVVTKDVSPYNVVGGVPAIVIKKRNAEER